MVLETIEERVRRQDGVHSQIIKQHNAMAQWLYDSSGHPIAFISGGDKVFSRRGHFVGRLDGDEVWHGRYKGELVRGDMFLYKHGKGSVERGTPGEPGSPGIPAEPGSRPSSGLPPGYDDVQLGD